MPKVHKLFINSVMVAFLMLLLVLPISSIGVIKLRAVEDKDVLSSQDYNSCPKQECDCTHPIYNNKVITPIEIIKESTESINNDRPTTFTKTIRN